MDKSLEAIVYNGFALTKDDQSISQEITDDIKGISAVYSFGCPLCNKTFQTSKKYRVTDNYVTDRIKSGIFFKISEFIWDTIGNIPLIGYYLRKRADAKVDKLEENIENKKDRKVLEKAFEEVKLNFVKCSSCENYSCSACNDGNICSECSDNSSVDDDEAVSELTAAFDQQIKDAESMYQQLIDQNPENKDMYMQQFEEQKKQIITAKEQALHNMNA